MKKAKAINFDMEELSDISDDLIEVNHDFFSKKTSTHKGSLRFPIPTPIKQELELKSGDTVYFCQYSEGYYISFKHEPTVNTRAQVRSRKLNTAGQYNTLYLCIPPMIKNLYDRIDYVHLIRTKGFQPYEWQIQFLSSDSI